MKSSASTLLRYRFWLVGVVILLLLVGGGIVLAHHNSKTANKQKVATTQKGSRIDYSPAKPSDNAANEQRKSGGAATNTSTLNSPSTAASFSVIVSRVSGSGVSITSAASVNGTISGNCVFEYARTKGGTAIVTSNPEPVQTTNSAAMCAPVTSIMPNGGSWYVRVSVTNNGQTATADWPNAINL